MSEVTVRWNQRVLGREPGHIETVELTPLIEGCLTQGRCVQVAGEQVVAPIEEAWNGLGPVPAALSPEPSPAEVAAENALHAAEKALASAEAALEAVQHPSETSIEQDLAQGAHNGDVPA